MKLEKEVTTQDGKRHLVPESGLEAYIKARTGADYRIINDKGEEVQRW